MPYTSAEVRWSCGAPALPGKFAVQAVELVEAGRKQCHHMAPGALALLPVDVVAQRIVEHGLELAPLLLRDFAQRCQHLRCGL
jgi:hypothetical protein